MKKLILILLSFFLPLVMVAQEGANTPEANYKKAKKYYKGEEFEKAFELFEKAAKQGYDSAQYSLGRIYLAEKRDTTNGIQWLEKAAKQGNSYAQNSLAILYIEGDGVEKDVNKAIQLFEIAAKQGDPAAQYNLGLDYFFGRNVKRNYSKAYKWLKKAANQGVADAQDLLGGMLANGNGVDRDYTKAFEWFERAANQGNAAGQYHLGMMYQHGLGIEKDLSKAFEWFERAANQGNAAGQYHLGMMYQHGLGIEKDLSKALKWFEKAADQGHEKAKQNLAAILREKASENVTKQVEEKEAMVSTQQQDQQEDENSEIEIDLVDSDIPVVNRINVNTFAIIIANENYEEESKVDYALNDGEVFMNYCYNTLGLPEKNVHFVANATLAKLIGELDWLQQVCNAYKSEASVIFYYAGHGMPDEKSGSTYLMPIDGNSRLLRTCYSTQELYETLGKLPAKKITVLMDANFSGAKRNGEMLASARGLAIKVKPSAPKGNMIVLLAAQDDETAYKFDEAQHGLFTYFLLKKLKDTKGDVTMGELSQYLNDEVGRLSIVENGKSQTPSIQISENLGNSWQMLKFD